MKHLFLALALLLCLSLPAMAQGVIVTNPTTAQFTASTDHSQLTKYELGYFLVGAADPVQVVDLGLPTPDANKLVSVLLPALPVAFNVYTARVRAWAGTISSEWSLDSNKFARAPQPTGPPVLKK